MSLPDNVSSVTDLSQRQAAAIAGYGYFVVFFLGIFSNFFAFQQLIVEGDIGATSNNIIANETLFRFGIAGWLIVIVCDTIIAWALYILFRSINRSLALLAAWFRIIFVAIFANSFVNHFSILQLLSHEGIETKLVYDQIGLLLNSQQYGVHISYVFFGVHVFLVGYLILKSGFIPKVLGILMVVAAFGYLINSFGNFVSSDYANNKITFLLAVAIPAIIAELSFTIWLVRKSISK